MPYIQIKAYPKDDETKKKVVDEINEIFLKHWGCPAEAISISIEEFAPEVWKKEVEDVEITPKEDKMMIFNGKKRY